MSPDRVISEIIRREGGYVNHPADRGGLTKYGITAATLGRWRKLGRDATADEIKDLAEPEARQIYRAEYLFGPRFDQVRDIRLQGLLVDCGVNSGPGQAAKWLQRAVGVAADGIVGPATLTAVNNADAVVLHNRLLAQRIRFLGRLITDDAAELAKPLKLRLQAENAAGWMARCAEFLES
jgi:lysozyme family protein